MVSVIVPARNEAANIARCVGSISASDYPSFEIVVVDDRSGDGTGAIARALAPGRAQRSVVVEGEPLPEGWLGKPWACWQGSRVARGGILLFTDADTIHAPELMDRAVAGLVEHGGDAITLAGRQLMESFWERLVQPQIFLTLLIRYHDSQRRFEPEDWRNAIANGQFILVRREAYEGIGGHEAVRGEVVEDVALAQRLVRDGYRFSMGRAEDAFSTRMYRSLRELVAGWSKNMVLGARMTLPPWMRPLAPAAMLAWGIGLWIVPPAALLVALADPVGDTLLLWSAATTAMSAVFWMATTHRLGAPFPYGLLYPLGAVVTAFILLRAWTRGSRVEWKGRTYRAEVAP